MHNTPYQYLFDICWFGLYFYILLITFIIMRVLPSGEDPQNIQNKFLLQFCKFKYYAVFLFAWASVVAVIMH
jgi:hypothetical protein